MTEHHGYHNTFSYANDYGASVISHELSMGGKYGYFEVVVIHGNDDVLCYSIEEFNHPVGWLSFDEVMPILDKIRYLNENPRCDHKRTTSSIEDIKEKT